MNYEITGSCASGLASGKFDLKPFLLLILSITFIPAAYIYVAAVFIVQLTRRNYRMGSGRKLYALIYAYVAIGLMSSEYKLISAAYVLIMLLCFYSFHMFSSMDESSIEKIKRLALIVSIIVFALGIIQYFNPGFAIPSKWVDKSEYNLSKRIYSTFFNPNVFGFYANFILLLSCENLDFKKINLEWASFAGGVICLILTFSRTSWVSIIAALIIASLFNKKYLKYAVIISIAIFTADALMGVGRANPIKSIEDSSILYRMEVWKASIEIIKDNFISGIGFGTLSRHIANYSSTVSTNVEHSHNLYIQVFTETGAIGFSIFLTLLWSIMKKFKNRLSAVCGSRSKSWITAFAVFAMTMIHGLVDSVPLTPQILMILSIYSGALSASDKKI